MPSDIEKQREKRLRSVIVKALDEVEREAARLGHVASVWDLTRAALEGRVRARKSRTISRATGSRLVGVRQPRRLRERGR